MEKILPKYHETFIPILDVLADGKVLHYNELRKQVRDKFYADLPSELLQQRTKSGDILILNRIGWAKAYLKQAELIHQPERALVQITEKGKSVLTTGHLTLKQLLSDKDFLKNRHIKTLEEDQSDQVISENASPEDMIDAGFSTIETQVKSDLLDKLKTVDSYYFQKIILKLLQKMGYGDFLTTPKSGDGGIDGIVNQDKLGLEKIYIQAKRYAENKVREKDIRDFIGAMSGDTQKGIFVTTSFFDEKAIVKAYEAHHKMILIDGPMLVDLMHRYSIGVQTKDVYEVKEIDEDFFEEN